MRDDPELDNILFSPVDMILEDSLGTEAGHAGDGLGEAELSYRNILESVRTVRESPMKCPMSVLFSLGKYILLYLRKCLKFK